MSIWKKLFGGTKLIPTDDEMKDAADKAEALARAANPNGKPAVTSRMVFLVQKKKHGTITKGEELELKRITDELYP
jgi:hypothetical protein